MFAWIDFKPLPPFVKADASAVMFTHRISQRDYFGIFTVALRTTWASTHGDVLSEELPFTDHCVLRYVAFVLSKADDASSLVSSPSIINSSRCLVRSSLRITRQQRATLVERIH